MFVKVTSLLALIAAVAAQSSTINTPASVVQCQPVQVSWTSTNTPVFISIIPGGQAGAAALQDFGQQTGTSLTWTANIAAGTSITFQLRDSTGAVAFSSPVTIQSSSDSSCLGASGSSAAGSSSAAATTPVASSSAPAATTSAAVTSAVSSASQAVSSAASSASTATAPATTSRAATSSAASVISSASGSASASGAAASSTNAALPTAKVGLAGLLGLAAAVVMA